MSSPPIEKFLATVLPAPLRITRQHDSFKTTITPNLATAIKYLIYERSTFFGHKVNRILPDATVL